MKESRKIVVYSLVAIAVFAGLYGWRIYSMSKVNQEIKVDGVVVIDSGLTADGIPSIDNPKFVDVATADELLGDDLPGIDFEVNGAHRFYPVQILNWHQVVNDTFGVEQIAVTFDPLTYSSAVYSRVVKDGQGEIMVLNASGKVYNNNSILVDSRGGQWIQLTGKNVDTDAALEELPSTFMKWGDWKEKNPSGEVLSSDTGSTFDYTRHPYGAYDTAKTVYFPLTNTSSALSPKWITTSVSANGQQLSFAEKIMDGKGVINDLLDGKNIVAFLDYRLGITRVFESNVAIVGNEPGGTRSFKYDFETHQITDIETGSVWSPEGLCTSGKHQGAQLTQIMARTSFWFAWSSQFPDTQIAGVDVIDEPVK